MADLLAALHVLDVLLGAIILAMAVIGFGQGTLKMLMIGFAVIAGFVMASIFYVPFAQFIAPFFGLDLVVNKNDVVIADAVSFFLLNLFAAVAIVFILFQYLGHIEVRGRYQSCLDKPVGMVLGAIAGMLMAATLVTLFSVPYEVVGNLKNVQDPGSMGFILHSWYTQSILGPPLRFQIMPYLLGLLTPIMPNSVPTILIGGHV